jgi:hypothetical protein
MLPDYILYLCSAINGCDMDGAAGVLHGLEYSIRSPNDAYLKSAGGDALRNVGLEQPIQVRKLTGEGRAQATRKGSMQSFV